MHMAICYKTAQMLILKQDNEFYVWLTLHVKLYLYNKSTRCTVYLHFIELPHLYMVWGPSVALHQEARRQMSHK
jgi:hypothetical protein